MFDHRTTVRRSAISSAVFAMVALGAIGNASAQEVPRSFVASPDVYKGIAQDDKYLVIEVTWKPGQRDQFHSHPAAAVYRLTDCNTRGYRPDGTFQENVRKAGQAAVQAPIVSHSVENIGKSDCRIIMFEPK